MILVVASCKACIDEPHKRLTVTAPTVFGISVNNCALRAMLKPCSLVCLTLPQIISSINEGSKLGLRTNNCCIKCADKPSARTLRKTPALERPIGVRIQSTMTTSFMIFSLAYAVLTLLVFTSV